MKFAVAWIAWLSAVLLALPEAARPSHLLAGWLSTTGSSFLLPAACWIAAWGLGGPLRRRLAPDVDDPLGARLLSAGFGWAVLQTVAVGLGLVGALGKPAAAALLAVGLAAAAQEIRRGRPEAPRSMSAPAAFGWAAFGALLAPTLLAAGAPPLASDEILYHLRFTEQLVATGGYVIHPADVESGFAQGLHSLLALPVALGGVEAARPFALLFALAALVAGQRVTLVAFGERAAAVYLPVVAGAASVVRFAPTVSTDWPVAFFVCLGLLIALPRLAEPRGGSPWALTLLGGAALSIKYTTPVFFGPIFVVLGVRALGDRALVVRLVTAGLACAAFAAPWMVLNAVHFGSPLHPFVGLPVPDGDPAPWVFNFTANYGPGSGWKAALLTPWELFAMGREFDRRLFLGRLNPWPLLALPALVLLLRSSRPGRALAVVVGLGFLAWMGALRRVAYLLPVWPAIAALTAGAIAVALDRLRPALLAPALVLLAAWGAVETASPRVDAQDDAAAACGMESPEQYRARRSDVEGAHAWIRDHVPPTDRVALFFVSKVHGIPNPTIFAGAEEMTPLRIALAEAGGAEAMATRLRGWETRWVLRRDPFFLPEQYPMLTTAQFDAGFARPRAIADDLLARFGVLRHSSGPYSVYELTEGPFATGANHDARR